MFKVWIRETIITLLGVALRDGIKFVFNICNEIFSKKKLNTKS